MFDYVEHQLRKLRAFGTQDIEASTPVVFFALKYSRCAVDHTRHVSTMSTLGIVGFLFFRNRVHVSLTSLKFSDCFSPYFPCEQG